MRFNLTAHNSSNRLEDSFVNADTNLRYHYSHSSVFFHFLQDVSIYFESEKKHQNIKSSGFLNSWLASIRIPGSLRIF